MSVNLKTPAEDYPVTLEEAKKQCEINTAVSRHDDYLLGLIRAATDYIERVTGRDLIERVWYEYFDRFPSGNGDIELKKGPVVSIAGITYTNPDASPQQVTVATSVYGLDNGITPSIVYLKHNQNWPTVTTMHNGVRIEYTSGYSPAGDDDPAVNVPEPLKQAIKMIVSDLFEHREHHLEMQTYKNPAVDMLIGEFMVYAL